MRAYIGSIVVSRNVFSADVTLYISITYNQAQMIISCDKFLLK